jgi:hypothetical protein
LNYPAGVLDGTNGKDNCRRIIQLMSPTFPAQDLSAYPTEIKKGELNENLYSTVHYFKAFHWHIFLNLHGKCNK